MKESGGYAHSSRAAALGQLSIVPHMMTVQLYWPTHFTMAEDDYQMAHVVVDLESVILIFSNYIYASLTKREVKKAGYWPSSFLPLSDSKMTLRSIKTPKRIQLSWPNKLGQKRIYFMAKKRTCSFGNDMGNPERPRWAHFACSSNQSGQRIRFFLPTCGFIHIMRQCGVVNQLLETFGF